MRVACILVIVVVVFRRERVVVDRNVLLEYWSLLHRHHNGHMFGLCRCRSFKLDAAERVRRFERWSLARSLDYFRVALAVGIKSLALALADVPPRFGAGVVRECDRAGSLVHLLLAWR